MTTMKIEARMIHEPVTVRADEDGSKKLDGYAAVFNKETVIGDYFREVIEPGAFKGALKDGDVRGLFNHDPNQVLGRTASKTMKLVEDDKGLRYVITPPDTTLGRDVLALVDRGDVTGSSFGFTVKRDSWTRPTGPGDLPLRTIHEVEWLRDVGPVTFPAYEETTVQARDAAAAIATAEAITTPPGLHPSVAASYVDIAEAEC
jgi:HK97 family phage prohead protease